MERRRNWLVGIALVAAGAGLGVGESAYALPVSTGGNNVVALPFAIPAATAYGTLITLLPTVAGNTITTWSMHAGRDNMSPYVGMRLTFPAGYLTAYLQATGGTFTYRSVWDTVFAYGGAGNDQELANQMVSNGEVRRQIEGVQASYLAGVAFSMRFWVDAATFGNATVNDREFFLYDCVW